MYVELAIMSSKPPFFNWAYILSSSRSHAYVRIDIFPENCKKTKNKSTEKPIQTFIIVDLAGAEGEKEADESGNINKTLMQMNKGLGDL